MHNDTDSRSVPLWKVPLIRELAAVLALKLLAIVLIAQFFFAEDVPVTGDSLDRFLFQNELPAAPSGQGKGVVL